MSWRKEEMAEHAVDLEPRQLLFWRDVLLLIHPIVAGLSTILRIKLNFYREESSDPCLYIFFRGIFRAYDILPPAVWHHDRDFWSTIYPGQLGFLGGVAAQVAFSLTVISIAVLLVAAVRTLLPARLARAILHP